MWILILGAISMIGNFVVADSKKSLFALLSGYSAPCFFIRISCDIDVQKHRYFHILCPFLELGNEHEIHETLVHLMLWH